MNSSTYNSHGADSPFWGVITLIVFGVPLCILLGLLAMAAIRTLKTYFRQSDNIIP